MGLVLESQPSHLINKKKRFHMPQLKIMRAVPKTQHSQINEQILKKKKV